MDKKSEFEYLKESIDKYNDALVDIFGEYELCISDNNIIIYLKSSSGKKFLYVPGSLEKDCICFSSKDDYKYDGFCFSCGDNEILVNEVKVDLHRNGANVERVERVYGKSRYDINRDTLLDLYSINYVIKKYSSFGELLDLNNLENNSLFTTFFSAHMRHYYQIPGESRSYTDSIYPSQVYFNGEDISRVYEFVDGIDKISRIYNLYCGNVKRESCDIETIISGLVDIDSYNYKNKKIESYIHDLIGEVKDVDVQDEMIQEYIESRTGKVKPVLVGLRDATFVEIGITPNQSRKRLNDKIDDIIDGKKKSKFMRIIRKIAK